MRTLLSIMLFLWLLAFSWLALWPFDFSRKNLATFVVGKGLKFRSPSMAISDGAPSKIAGLDSFAVVLRFLPDSSNGAGCLLDYAPDEGPTNLRIVQQRHRLEFAFRMEGQEMKHLHVRIASLDSLCAFAYVVQDGNVSIVDLHRAVTCVDMRTPIGSNWDRKAQLIFGCTASGKLRWEGTLVSFEVYSGGDTNSFPIPGKSLLSYQFAQPSGRMIPDIGREPRTPLLVPAQIKAPARKILSSPLAYWDRRSNTSDIYYNVVAFLPLGILLGLLFKMHKREALHVLVVTGIACLFSLSVEVAQYFVPYRDSSIVDVITNSFGAFCGAWLSTWIATWPPFRSR
jgi:hypothetical protein